MTGPVRLHDAVSPFAETPTWRLARAYLAKEGLPAALASYCRAMTQAPNMVWPADKIFAQKTRYMICYMIIGNYVRWRRGTGEPPTLAALQKHAVASPRHVAGFIQALRLGNFVVTAPSKTDRRSVHLQPGSRLLAEIARSPLSFLDASERIDPADRSFAAALRECDERLCEVLAHSTERFIDRDILFAPFSTIVHFTERDCGYPILAAVMGHHYEASLSTDEGPMIALTYDALAERFRVSRQHVGNILIEAERRGWFTVAQGGRLMAVSGELVHEFETWAAGQMAHYRMIAGELAQG